MYEPADRFADPPAHPAFAAALTDAVPPASPARDGAAPPHPAIEADSFMDLLAELDRRPPAGDRGDTIARYQGWIGRNSAASIALYAAWFNLGVELSGAGDRTGAMDAYQHALALRPGFYPAAINLGTLLEAGAEPEAALAVWQQALQPEDARTTLLAYRGRLVEDCLVGQQGVADVLHIGCGGARREELPPVFRRGGWRETRVDADPGIRAAFVAAMTDLRGVSDGQADAVYSSAITYLCPHEVRLALQEMHRVLKPAGFALIAAPDLQEVARHVAEGKLEDPLYISPEGPIAPLDILYGHRPALANGDAVQVQAPRTGFTGTTLAAALIKAGFAAAMVQRDGPSVRLTAIAFPNRPDEAELARMQAQMLPAAGQAAVLYAPAG